MDAKAAQFERHRPRLFKIAYRLLGTISEAEDVVQEAYLRWSAVTEVRSPGKLLATIVTRLALDVLKSARRERERYVGQWLPEVYIDEPNPEDTGVLADDLSYGFMAMLERLTPDQRAVFVLRVAFDLDYAEIAATLSSSPANCRQLMASARTRMTGPARCEVDSERSRALAHRFAHACNAQSLTALRGLLADDCQLISDADGLLPAARNPILGPDRVSRMLVGVRRKYGNVFTPLDLFSGASPVLRYEYPEFRGLALLDVDGDAQVTGVFIHWNPKKLRHTSALVH